MIDEHAPFEKEGRRFPLMSLSQGAKLSVREDRRKPEKNSNKKNKKTRKKTIENQQVREVKETKGDKQGRKLFERRGEAPTSPHVFPSQRRNTKDL